MESQLYRINETFLPELKGKDGGNLSDLDEKEEDESEKDADKEENAPAKPAKQSFKPIRG